MIRNNDERGTGQREMILEVQARPDVKKNYEAEEGGCLLQASVP